MPWAALTMSFGRPGCSQSLIWACASLRLCLSPYHCFPEELYFCMCEIAATQNFLHPVTRAQCLPDMLKSLLLIFCPPLLFLGLFSEDLGRGKVNVGPDFHFSLIWSHIYRLSLPHFFNKMSRNLCTKWVFSSKFTSAPLFILAQEINFSKSGNKR